MFVELRFHMKTLKAIRSKSQVSTGCVLDEISSAIIYLGISIGLGVETGFGLKQILSCSRWDFIGPQACCGWCGPGGSIKYWYSNRTGAIYSRVLMQRDENQHLLQAATTSPGIRWGAASSGEFKHFSILFRNEAAIVTIFILLRIIPAVFRWDTECTLYRLPVWQLYDVSDRSYHINEGKTHLWEQTG